MSPLRLNEEAIVAYEEAIRLNPVHFEAHFGKGVALALFSSAMRRQ